jgi:Sec-independent protein translocase protein TatA
MKDKTKPIFGLDKLPDDAIIKELRTELGKANSYIQELENELKQALNNVKEYKANKVVQTYKDKVLNLEKKNKKLNDFNERLIYQLNNK